MPIYKTHQQVMSQHCDATGIAFFPRISEMAHEVIERWFDEALDWSFARMHGGDGVATPVVRASAEYPSASRLGDHLIWKLTVTNLGRTSLDLRLVAASGGESRVEMDITVVLSDIGVIRPRAWPEAFRARALEYRVERVTQ